MIPPLRARTCDLSTEQSSRSSRPARRRSASRAVCRRGHTPASVQSRSRRQAVTPGAAHGLGGDVTPRDTRPQHVHDAGECRSVRNTQPPRVATNARQPSFVDSDIRGLAMSCGAEPRSQAAPVGEGVEYAERNDVRRLLRDGGLLLGVFQRWCLRQRRTDRAGSRATRVRAAIRRSGPVSAPVSNWSTAAATAAWFVSSWPRIASRSRARRQVKSANGAETRCRCVHGTVIHSPARDCRSAALATAGSVHRGRARSRAAVRTAQPGRARRRSPPRTGGRIRHPNAGQRHCVCPLPGPGDAVGRRKAGQSRPAMRRESGPRRRRSDRRPRR